MYILNWIITLHVDRFKLFYVSVVSHMFIIMTGSVKEILNFLSPYILCLWK